MIDALTVEVADAVRDVSVDGYLPETPMTSDVEDATVVALAGQLENIVVTDAYSEADANPPRYWASLEIETTVAVAWYVSAVSSYDMEALSSIVETPDAGGLIQDIDDDTVRLQVAAVFTPSEGTWSEVEIEAVTLPEAEVKARLAQNPDPAFEEMAAHYAAQADEQDE